MSLTTLLLVIFIPWVLSVPWVTLIAESYDTRKFVPHISRTYSVQRNSPDQEDTHKNAMMWGIMWPIFVPFVVLWYVVVYPVIWILRFMWRSYTTFVQRTINKVYPPKPYLPDTPLYLEHGKLTDPGNDI